MTATGSGAFYLTQPSYKAKLFYLDGGDLQVDSVVSYDFVGTEQQTWGAVKSIYR